MLAAVGRGRYRREIQGPVHSPRHSASPWLQGDSFQEVGRQASSSELWRLEKQAAGLQLRSSWHATPEHAAAGPQGRGFRHSNGLSCALECPNDRQLPLFVSPGQLGLSLAAGDAASPPGSSLPSPSAPATPQWQAAVRPRASALTAALRGAERPEAAAEYSTRPSWQAAGSRTASQVLRRVPCCVPKTVFGSATL